MSLFLVIWVSYETKHIGAIHKLHSQEEGGSWSKESTFCQYSYHRKCQRRGVSGQKKPNLVNVVCERPHTGRLLETYGYIVRKWIQMRPSKNYGPLVPSLPALPTTTSMVVIRPSISIENADQRWRWRFIAQSMLKSQAESLPWLLAHIAKPKVLEW